MPNSAAERFLRGTLMSVLAACLSGCATQRVHDAVSAIGTRRWEIQGNRPSQVTLAKDGSMAVEMPAVCRAGWGARNGRKVYSQRKYLIGTRRAVLKALARAQRVRDPSTNRVQIVGDPGPQARYLLMVADVREPGWTFVPDDRPGRLNCATDDMLPAAFRRPDVLAVAMFADNRNTPEMLPPLCYPQQDLPLIVEVSKGGIWMGREYRTWWGYPVQILHLPLYVVDTAAVVVAFPVALITMPFWLPEKLSGI